MPTVITEPVHTAEYIVSEANGSRSREIGTITGSTDLVAGTVLGQVAVGATAVAAALGTNTGNGTFGAIAVGAPAVAGAYTLRMQSATGFVVEDPLGAEIGHGTTGSAYSAGGLGFTLTAGGTAFVAGDSFTITPAAGSGKYAQLNLAGTDGTEVPAAILYQGARVSQGDVVRTVHKRGCEVNGNLLTWPAGISSPQLTAATAALALLGIIIRN